MSEMYRPTEDVYVTREGLRTPSPRYVVPGTHRAAYLLVAAHNEIPMALAERYGLLDPEPTPESAALASDPSSAADESGPPLAPAPVDQDPPAPDAPLVEAESKAKKPVADKAIKPAEDK